VSQADAATERWRDPAVGPDERVRDELARDGLGQLTRPLGIHQGLAPVMDVARDLRWGRVEETMGEVLDVLLPPFEMALRAGARSVMNAYTDIDGLPVAADPAVLDGLLRGSLGFRGTVVADYFSVTFLQTLHGVAGIAVDLVNESRRRTSEVVQVYLHDPVAEVVRPVQRLVAAARVDLPLGARKRVRIAAHADLGSFTGRAGVRIVEPGAVALRVGASSGDIRAVVELSLAGPRREVGSDRVLEPTVVVEEGR